MNLHRAPPRLPLLFIRERACHPSPRACPPLCPYPSNPFRIMNSMVSNNNGGIENIKQKEAPVSTVIYMGMRASGWFRRGKTGQINVRPLATTLFCPFVWRCSRAESSPRLYYPRARERILWNQQARRSSQSRDDSSEPGVNGPRSIIDTSRARGAGKFLTARAASFISCRRHSSACIHFESRANTNRETNLHPRLYSLPRKWLHTLLFRPLMRERIGVINLINLINLRSRRSRKKGWEYISSIVRYVRTEKCANGMSAE